MNNIISKIIKDGRDKEFFISNFHVYIYNVCHLNFEKFDIFHNGHMRNSLYNIQNNMISKFAESIERLK